MNSQVNCGFFKEHLDAYLDSALDQKTRGQMISHADQCPECGERLETMTRLLTMCAELDEGLQIPLNVQAAWRKAVREEAAKAPQTQKKKKSGGLVRRVAGWTAVAAAALVVGTFAYRVGSLPVSRQAIVPQMTTGESDMGAGGGVMPRLGGLAPEAKIAAGNQNIWVDSDGSFEPEAIAPEGAPDGFEDTTLSTQAVTASAADTEKREKIVLRSAQRGLESSAFDQTMQLIRDLVLDVDGWLERESIDGQALKPGQAQGRVAGMTARVPEASLDEFLASLDAAATISYQSESQDDISSSYYDVKMRLTSYRAQLERYNELVGTAAGLEDMLMLEGKIYETQLEIDRLEGQIAGWNSYARESTVYITLTEVAARDQVQDIGSTFEERVRVAFFDSLNWLNAFLQDAAVVLAMIAPALVVAVPVLIVLGVIISAIRRHRRRKGK